MNWKDSGSRESMILNGGQGRMAAGKTQSGHRGQR